MSVPAGKGARSMGASPGMLSVKPEMILVDLDGTMVDSVPDLALCVDIMMRHLGLPERGEARVREWIGNGVERLVKRALVGAYEGEPEEALFKKALPVFLEAYEKNVCVGSRPYPGVEAGLKFLSDAGYPLGCVTNKAARFTEPLLDKLGLAKFFGIIVSGDTLPVKKPDPAPLLHAAEFFRVAPEKSLLIGDSISDVKAARAAGFEVVCVSYGYNHGMDIREAGPDVVIDSMEQMRTVLP